MLEVELLLDLPKFCYCCWFWLFFNIWVISVRGYCEVPSWEGVARFEELKPLDDAAVWAVDCALVIFVFSLRLFLLKASLMLKFPIIIMLGSIFSCWAVEWALLSKLVPLYFYAPPFKGALLLLPWIFFPFTELLWWAPVEELVKTFMTETLLSFEYILNILMNYFWILKFPK